jgi:hypothetical protein
MFLFIDIGNPCPNKIIYININALNKMLRFSAIICFCPSIKIIKTYNKIPISTECNNIIRPLSIYIHCLEKK